MSPASLTERLGEGARRRTRRRIIAAVCALAVVAAAAVAWFSPLLALQSVTVRAGELTDPAAVEELVLEKHRGQPLPQIRLGGLEGEIVAAESTALRADVRWSGPRSLSVAVVDRTPALAVADGADFLRYDETGVLIDTVGEDAVEGLPRAVFTGSAQPEATAPSLVSLVAAGAHLPGTVVEAKASSPHALSLIVETEEGERATVDFGDASDLEKKAEVAAVLLAEGKTAIDVSAPLSPAAR